MPIEASGTLLWRHCGSLSDGRSSVLARLCTGLRDAMLNSGAPAEAKEGEEDEDKIDWRTLQPADFVAEEVPSNLGERFVEARPAEPRARRSVS